MRPLTLVLGSAVSIAAATPAAASGRFECLIDDLSVRFEMAAGVSRDIGAGFFDVRGAVQIYVEGVPHDLRRVGFDGEDLIHSWLDDDEAKLRFVHERPDGDLAQVDLTIEADLLAGEEGKYFGTYVLTVHEIPASGAPLFGAWASQGLAACRAE